MKSAMGALCVFVLVVLIVVSLSGTNTSRAETSIIYVPDNYSTIQGAVNAAQTGSTIIVRVGTYFESVVINKTISLKSEDGPQSTVISAASSDYNVVMISADNVEVSGFTMKGYNPGNDAFGIYAYSTTGGLISNNTVTGLLNSTNLSYGLILGDNFTVIGNSISGWKFGASTGSYALIVSNREFNNQFDLYLAGVGSIIYLNMFNDSVTGVNPPTAYKWYSQEPLNYVFAGRSYSGYVGNYWASYHGSDLGGDGIGDTPYSINWNGGTGPGGAADDYPIMAYGAISLSSPVSAPEFPGIALWLLLAASVSVALFFSRMLSVTRLGLPKE
jgi:hypothetical protein